VSAATTPTRREELHRRGLALGWFTVFSTLFLLYQAFFA
jgi:hypothetical protein